MEMTYWLVDTPYDGKAEDHWQSQSRIRRAAMDLGIQIKWLSGKSTPSSWLGYTTENPTPGYRIDSHTWRIDNENDAMLFYLAHGNSLKSMEVKNE